MPKYKLNFLSFLHFRLPLFSLCLLLLFSLGFERAAQASINEEYLQGLDIAPEYQEAKGMQVGAIDNLSGKAVVIHQDHETAYYAAIGDPIHEGDIIMTMVSSSCRLKFNSRDIAILGENSLLEIKDYLDDRQAHMKQQRYRASQGNLLFYVLKIFGYNKIDVEVETPSTVAAVRGTKFGIGLHNPGFNAFKWLVDSGIAGQKEDFLTDIFCEEGLVLADDIAIPGGQLLLGGTSTTSPLTEEYLRNFYSTFNFDSKEVSEGGSNLQPTIVPGAVISDSEDNDIIDDKILIEDSRENYIQDIRAEHAAGQISGTEQFDDVDRVLVPDDRYDPVDNDGKGDTDITDDNDSTDDSGSSDDTDITDGHDSTDGTDSPDISDSPDSTDSTDSTDITDSPDSTDSTDSHDSTDSTDSHDSTDSTDSNDSHETT